MDSALCVDVIRQENQWAACGVASRLDNLLYCLRCRTFDRLSDISGSSKILQLSETGLMIMKVVETVSLCVSHATSDEQGM